MNPEEFFRFRFSLSGSGGGKTTFSGRPWGSPYLSGTEIDHHLIYKPLRDILQVVGEFEVLSRPPIYKLPRLTRVRASTIKSLSQEK
jgi:hypothetical protein